MSMSDEEYESALAHFIPEIKDKMRARDTAQREALARVEAERDALREQVVKSDAVAMANHFACDAAQAQLAEAVGLLRCMSRGEYENSLCQDDVDAFLARHAQAEQQEARETSAAEAIDSLTQPLCVISLRGDDRQKALANALARIIRQYHGHDQEAQGAQAGDERAAFERWSERADKFHVSGYNPHSDLWEAWQARAALATQPAAGEPAATRLKLPTPEQVMNVVMKFQWEDRKNGTGTTNWAANLGMTVVEYVARLNSAPPAATHGYEAVRIDARLLELYQAPFRFDERGGYIWDAKDNMVADNHVEGDQTMRVRGWGRLSYRKDGAEVQDLMGQAMADALTARWNVAMRAQGDGE